MRIPTIAIGLVLSAALLTACSGGDETAPSPSPSHTIAVEPVRDLTSPAITASTSAPEGTTPYEGEWFTLSLPEGAAVTAENQDLSGQGDSMYTWVVNDYDVTLQKTSAESSKIAEYPGTNLAEDHALYYLTMMDGSGVDTAGVQAGPLEGWALDGYYVSQSIEDDTRTVKYFLSNDKVLITFTYTVPFEEELPHDIMNTLVLKEEAL